MSTRRRRPGWAASGTAATTFDIRYAAGLRPLFGLLGMGPARSGVEVTAETVRVRMGWAFRARIPLADVRHVTPDVRPLVWGWGVHGVAGRWLVNGSSHGLVRLDVHPPCRATVLGVPVRLSTLWVSFTDPSGFMAALPRVRSR
jgi:hypothetical protein